MRYREIMLEGRDAPLYHWMEGVKKTRNTLQSDMLEARVIHPIPDLGEVRGISLSRNKHFTFGDRGQVRLTLDQAKLAQSYKLIPLDGEAAFRRRHELEPTAGERVTTRDEKWKFAEEFVVGDIKPLHRYVVAVFVQRRSSVVLPVEEYLACAAYAEQWAIPLHTDPSTLAADVLLWQRRHGRGKANGLVEANDLPMDKASRYARAEAMGFDTSTVYYHGMPSSSAKDVRTLQRGNWERVEGEPAYFSDMTKNPNAVRWVPAPLEKQMVWFTPLPKYASKSYAQRYNKHEGAVYPVFLRRDAVKLPVTPNEVYVTDLTAIRSIHADFDPARADVADLSA